MTDWQVITSNATQALRGRPVTNAEALEAAQHLIDSHFGVEHGAITRVPAQVEDDDILLTDYLLEAAALESRLAAAEAALSEANVELARLHKLEEMLAEQFDEAAASLRFKNFVPRAVLEAALSEARDWADNFPWHSRACVDLESEMDSLDAPCICGGAERRAALYAVLSRPATEKTEAQT